MPRTKLTILNSMADSDFVTALDKHQSWGLEVLDLRDEIYGKWVAELSVEEAESAKEEIDTRNLEVHCLSTGVFIDGVEQGEQYFREKHLADLDHVLELAQVLKPHFVRLIAAQLKGREKLYSNAIDYIDEEHPWVFDVYREGIDRISEAGFRPTIENEAYDCFLSTPQEFVDFFGALDRDAVSLTWDVQNQWSTGVFPSIEVYEELKPLIGYYHVKGGQTEDGSTELAWNVALEDASWPVFPLTRRVTIDGVSPVICINPPQHGQRKSGYDYSDITERDIKFLKSKVPGVS